MKTQIKLIFSLSFLLALSTGSFAQPSQQGGGQGQRSGPPVFTDLDTDSDGYISYEEFSSNPIPHGEHETVFNSIDSDSDGFITENELSSHKPPRRSREES